jgi:hypothetical protein
METLRRFSQYLRSPLILCGTVQTLGPSGTSSSHLEDVPNSFYQLFGRPLGYVKDFRNVFKSNSFALESVIEPFRSPEEDIQRLTETPIESNKRDIFRLLGLPTVRGHDLTDNMEVFLEEGKMLVPSILSASDSSHNSLDSIYADHGFHLVGTAVGTGFTCSVYRKQTKGGIPLYVITGDLAMTSETFHSLACDIEFRHEWDDQFQQASVEAVEGNISLVNWVVKWPWPLAPREYNYLLTPKICEDGTRLVMATSVVHSHKSDLGTKAVPVKEYFGITASKPLSGSSCRYCLYYYDDPRLPGKMPDWLEQHVTKKLLPSFPRKMLEGSQKYPNDRLAVYSTRNSTNAELVTL